MSHETIYRSLFIQARGVLKKELLEHLRARRSERPPSVEDRAVPGHWEGDLIGGSGNSYVATSAIRAT